MKLSITTLSILFAIYFPSTLQACDVDPGILNLIGESQLASVVCSSGTAYYPNGAVAGSAGGTWYYPNGAVAGSKGGTWYHSNGSVAGSDGGTWYYSNGAVAGSVGSTWYYQNGSVAGQLF